MLQPPFYDSLEEYDMKKKYPFSWFTHNRDKEGDFGVRAVLHIPIGLFMGATFPLSLGLVYLFKFYERNEDAHTKDQAWKDVFGAMIGMVLGISAEIAILIAWLT